MNEYWPKLPLAEWKDTCSTLHLLTQIVGKIRLVQSPWINHSWHSTLYVTPRGLTTASIPYGQRTFQIDFDFIDHQLLITTIDGTARTMGLGPRSVADFYKELFAKLSELDLKIKIHKTPNELPNPIRFDKDTEHKSYDAEYVHRFWRALAQADRVLKKFRARFWGKCSPVHFFWGSFDLAVTRFSGRRAPQHPGGVPYMPDWVVREAYSHEVSSCGWWPGNDQYPQPAFYSYTYPEPEGFSAAPVRPDGAGYSSQMREFIYPYDELLKSSSLDDAVLDFAQSTYEAGADLGKWNRAELERDRALAMTSHALIDADDSVLIAIDIQDYFLKKLSTEESDRLLKRAAWLIKVAQWRKIPIVVTAEELQKHPVSPKILESLPSETRVFDKRIFGLTYQSDIIKAVQETQRNTAVLIGLETDVCVAHSAVGLLEHGYRVAVVADATGSPENGQEIGLNRMRNAGAVIVSAKSVFYEWIRNLEWNERFQKECPELDKVDWSL